MAGSRTHGRTATYIGPLIATTASAAMEFLNRMLVRFAGEEVCLDLHTGGFLEAGVIAERGLAKRRSLTRMRHGSPSEAGTARSMCASAGPELG